MTIAAATFRCRGNHECVGRERWHRLVLALAAITVAQPAALWAHPRLARAVPAQGARLTPAPTEIRLTFTEVAELTFTRLTLSPREAIPSGCGGETRNRRHPHRRRSHQ